RGSECIGTIGVVRKVAGAFSDKEIALMQSFVDQAVIAIENVRLFNETQEALEQQTATAEVLQVVSGSMADATPVFEKILDSCERLFGTHDLAVFLTDGQTLPQPTAFRGSFASWASTSYPRPLAGTLSGMVLERRELMYWPDTLAASEMPEYMKQIGREHGNFAGCTAPLLWEGQGIGTLNVMRRPPRPFSEQDLALLKTFADQAVIAIQNARLFNETKEALERQTATAEVLRVMSSSPADVQPVLDAVAERSAALCKGAWSTVWLAEGDALHARAASAGDTQRGIDLVQTMPVPIKRTVTSGRAFVDKRFVHVEDIVPLLDSDYPDAKVNQQRFGFRTMLSVPMVREGQSIGVIGLYRDQVRPFSVAEIGLVQTFADQAVIAIENVRLFNETREALEQQTATAEILRVISGSVTDTQPVFDAIVQSCRRLFAGKAVALAMPKGDMIESVAFAGDGQTPAQGGFLRPWPLDHGSGAGSCILDSRLIAVADTVAGASRFPRMPQLAVALGYHSALFVPLLREGKAVGCLAILRAQAGEFDAQEVALAQTFADQAVIAIENARLFNETQEALERQTATSDILRVISESPADVQPVFDAIVRAGVRLFDNAAVAVSQPVGDKVVLRAIAESNARLADQWRERFPVPLTPDYMHGAALLQGRLIDVGDVLADDTPYQAGKRNFALSGYRAMTVVPMMRDGVAIGAVSVIRTAVGCLPDKQVELLKTFADQAVIAIENVRLFNETKEALEQQKASADILRVISSSVADTQPVFDKILDSCKILFGGDELDVLLVDDQERLTVAAYVGQARETIEATFPAPVVGSAPGLAITEGRAIQYADVLHAPDIPPVMRRMGELVGYHSIAFAPMLWEGRGIGVVGVARSRGAFSDKELALLQTFADQAVIAIQNARLFHETQEALARQTATSDVLQVISESPTDVQPVFDIIAEQAASLTAARFCLVTRLDGEQLQLVSLHGVNEAGSAALRAAWPQPVASSTSIAARAIRTRSVVNVADLLALPDDEYAPEMKRACELAGFRSGLSVPMIRDQQVVGAITVNRAETGLYADKEVALLQTFARQAVVAVENVRLFNETKEALEHQTATSDVLQVISGSMANAAPVFEKILDSCQRLFGATDMGVFLVEGGDRLNAAAWRGEFADVVPGNYPRPLVGTMSEAVIRHGSLRHWPDVANAADVPGYISDVVRQHGNFSVAVTPLLWEGRGIGTLDVMRKPPRPYTEKELALLRSFADQAVIAIQNARLFNETQEALERQTATADVLKVIAGSPSDVRPVFDAIAASSKRLLGGFSTTVFRIVDGVLHLEAFTPTNEQADATLVAMFPRPIAEFPPFAMVSAGQMAHVEDTETDADVPQMLRDIARRRGYRAMLFTPLMREGAVIGMISVTREAPGPFADHHRQLLRTFADQAVIAIENVRLFNETKEALEQQRTSGEVLKVISNSVADTAPVFEAIGKACQQLFSGDQVVISLVDADGQVSHASMATPPELGAQRRDYAWALLNRGFPRPLEKSYQAYPIRKRRVVHYPDMVNGPGVPEDMRRIGRDGENFSMLIAPMLWENQGIGTVHIVRVPPRPFSDTESALLQTFADQAVIAI
ncbi:MAG: GAF domain-containing protein, partial [Aquincola sp.]|nr:GAF domain-containing protein [Aquincola sp.]